MSISPRSLPAIPLPGLRPDSLGNYLATLGLLRLLARRWPQVRIAWKNGVLHVVGGPQNLDDLLDHLVHVATVKSWTPYEHNWASPQRESTKRQSGAPLAKWQALAPEEHLELFAAHIVPRERAYFNPLLGTGGNAGRRAFSDGWQEAVKALSQESAKPTGRARSELQSLLLGRPVCWLVERLNAASWFSDANKLCNSGQRSAREGLISPWAMALSCEGLPFFAGAASRRLGARARAVAAFPFVTQAAAPVTAGEAGRDNAEVWAPLWEWPMSLPEVSALFARARAEIRGRGAITPAAFSAAIVQRGVDAGIAEFLRFSLGRTTSANTFEPRFEGRILLHSPQVSPHTAEAVPGLREALDRIVTLFDRLPRDQKKGKRWRYAGLRGPIERAIVHLAAAPADAALACALLDAVVTALDKVDRNQEYRSQKISWEPLPLPWLPTLFGPQGPTLEARLALAAVSGFPPSLPFALYRFGVEWKPGGYIHPKVAPLRWVWGAGELPRVLAAVLTRRVLDWNTSGENGSRKDPPARVLFPVSCHLVNSWLDGQLDEQALKRWLARFALFDWRRVQSTVLKRFSVSGARGAPTTGALAMFGLFQPLLDLEPACPPASGSNLFDGNRGARTPAAARRLLALIRTGQAGAAVSFAKSRYAMAGASLVKTAVPWAIEDPHRLLASLLFPIPPRQRGLLIQRWLRPQRDKGEIAYA